MKLQSFAYLLPILGGAGCATRQHNAMVASSAVRVVAQLEQRTDAKPKPAYTIAPGDEIEVSFSYHPEFSRKMEVWPDGRIALPLIGDVMAAEKTPSNLAQELEAAYAGELKEPNIVVIVHRALSNVAYIGGEVNAPQMIPLDRPTTLLQALIRCGNVKPSAEENNVLVLRASPDKTTQIFAMDLKRIRRGEDAGLLLEPYDVVYVPKSIIAEVGEFVDAYINRIIPRNIGFQYIYGVQDEQTEDDGQRILFSRTNIR